MSDENRQTPLADSGTGRTWIPRFQTHLPEANFDRIKDFVENRSANVDGVDLDRPVDLTPDGIRLLKKLKSCALLTIREAVITRELLAAIAEIASIERLAFERCTLECGSFRALRQLTKLQALSFQGTLLTASNMFSLCGLKGIRELNLSGWARSFNELAVLPLMIDLEELQLLDTFLLPRDLAFIRDMVSLKKLCISNNPFLRETGYLHLLNGRKLEEVDAINTGISAEMAADFPGKITVGQSYATAGGGTFVEEATVGRKARADSPTATGESASA